MFYGKIFSSCYTGSAYGSGPIFFSLWPYIIANQQCNKDRTIFEVELNPPLLAGIIGKVTEDEIRAEIEKMCQPDPKSRTETEDGRRLIKVGSFLYRVVNGSKYHRIKNEEDRREQNREAQARRRAKLAEKAAKKLERDAKRAAVKDGMIEDRMHDVVDQAKRGEI